VSEAARVHVIFRGRVQGVGFRYTTTDIASGHDVTGYVANRADGSVELVAEGARAEAEAFVRALSQRMARYIRSTELAWEAPTGEFCDFDIRFGGG
jgi:acylphosphatase